jgi:hypothetical protein
MMLDFGILARKVANRNPRAPFSLFIEYKGMSDGDEKLGLITTCGIQNISRVFFKMD